VDLSFEYVLSLVSILEKIFSESAVHFRLAKNCKPFQVTVILGFWKCEKKINMVYCWGI